MKTPPVVFLAPALAAALAGPARADAPLPPAARHIVESRFAGWVVESRSVGALQGAGAQDIALVLARGDAPLTHAVAVLLDDGHQGWRFSKSSSAIDLDSHGEALAADIRAGGLIVRTTVPRADVAIVTRYRFTYRDGGRALRLVGLDVERVFAGDGGHGWRDLVRTDLLNGVKVETLDDRLGTPARHRQAESRLAVRQPILFEQFAFDTRGLVAEASARFEAGAGKR